MLQGRLIQRGHDQENRIGTSDRSFKDLGFVDDEILAQHRDADLATNVRHVVEAALEILLVRQHRDGIGTSFFIGAGDGEVVEVRLDHAS